MTPPADPERYKNHRFPGEIISHGVWLYYRFPLSYRDVQELLLERGIDVTHEAIRQWCPKFGQDYANQLKRRRAQPGDKWHLDEVFLAIHGQRHYLWRGRSGRSCPRHPGAEPPQQASGEEVLSQVAQGVTVRATGDHHRSAQELRRGEARDLTWGGTSPESLSQ